MMTIDRGARLPNASCSWRVTPGLWLLLLAALVVLASAALPAAGNDTRPRGQGKSAPTRLTSVAVGQPMAHRPAVAARADCNGNGIPDEDDIENCDGSPWCDDCNLTGLPDVCDITAGTSIDADLDGVPDECVFFDGGGADGNWSNDANWDDDQSPDNQNQAEDFSVTIDSGNADLDEDVEVDTLRLLEGAVLNVTGTLDENLLVEEPGGLLIRSRAGMQSRLRATNGRQIAVTPGLLHIRSGGIYEGEPPSGARAGGAETGTVTLTNDALLTAGDVLIESRCGKPIPGEMDLSGSMGAHVLGDFVIDASQDCVVCVLCSMFPLSTGGSVAGGETPPILRVRNSAVLQVDGNLSILGSGSLLFSSSQPLVLGGSFVNESPCPECFEFSGPLTLGLPIGGVATVGGPQSFEVSGRDVGPIPDGFVNNFAVQTIEVTGGADVTFENGLPNAAPGLDEALYVDTLILGSGSVVSVAGCRLYYNTLVDEGGAVTALDGGTMQQVHNDPPIPAVSTWGLICLVLLLLVVGTAMLRRHSRPVGG